MILNAGMLFTGIACILVLAMPRKFGVIITAAAILFNALSTSYLAINVFIHSTVDLTFNFGSFTGDVLLRIDSLAAWFMLLVNLTVLTGFFFGIGYLRKYVVSHSRINLHWVLIVLFHLSMVYVCLIQNSLAFLIFWEIMSLTSMMLVLFDHDNPSTYKAALNYFVQMHIGVTLLTIGFIWVYYQTGSFSFEAIGTFFRTNPNRWLFLLLFTGFGIKAGFIPFHSWLPHAHPAAPAHISGVMSGVIVKLGIYGIFRMISFLAGDYLLLGEIILTLSILTGLYGILNAAVHRDFKRMLAYCTIENIGIIGIGIGIGLIGIGNGSPIISALGFSGALLHVLNHSLYKSLLFYSAGSVVQQTHTQNIEHLGGLIKSMPRSAILFLIGSLAICGLPPFNGFISEFLIYNGLIEGIHSTNISQIILLVLSLAGMSIIGGLSILTFSKSFGTIFLGQSRKALEHTPKEVSRRMLWPQYLIVVVMLSISLLPQFFMKAIKGSLVILNPAMNLSCQLDQITLTTARISLYSVVILSIILVVWGVRWLITARRPEQIDATWGCGYVAPNCHQQYTGKSFSKPLSKIFNALLIEKKQYAELEKGEIFPANRSYVSHYYDFFERSVIEPVTNNLVHSANYFSFVQNGRIQSYVLYGIIFILAMVVLTIFNLMA